MTHIFNEQTKVDGVVDLGAEVSKVGGIDKMATTDTRAVQLLEGILTTLKKIEYHLYLGTDTELNDQDVF